MTNEYDESWSEQTITFRRRALEAAKVDLIEYQRARLREHGFRLTAVIWGFPLSEPQFEGIDTVQLMFHREQWERRPLLTWFRGGRP